MESVVLLVLLLSGIIHLQKREEKKIWLTVEVHANFLNKLSFRHLIESLGKNCNISLDV